MADDTFAERWWAHNRALDEFETKLLDLGDEGFDFDDTHTDSYDMSIEVNGVSPADYRLNEAQRKFLFESGFSCAFVNPLGTRSRETIRLLSTPEKETGRDG